MREQLNDAKNAFQAIIDSSMCEHALEIARSGINAIDAALQSEPASVPEVTTHWTRGGAIHRLPPPKTRQAPPSNEILNRADGVADSVLVLAYNKQGETYFDTNILDGGDVLWLLENCKKTLLEGK